MVQVMITSTSGTLRTFSLGKRGAQAERGQVCVARARALHSDHCHCRETVTFLFQYANHLSAQQQSFFCLEKHRIGFLLVEIELLNKQDLR